MNMHEKLRPIKIGDKYAIPRAPYQLTSLERRRVSEWLSKVKVPDGDSSNIARCASLEDGKISNMKSHDCHLKYELGEGSHIRKAIKIQCSTLYRLWRERLKADYFSNRKSLLEAERACPPSIKLDQWKWLFYDYWSSPKQKERSEKNRANALAKKIKSACGVKSIARIIYELELEAQACENENEDIEINEDPMYLKLWHKNGKFDDEAEEKFKELRELHENEIGEKGVDNLTLEEAYVKVLGHCSGYARGLGKGHPVLSKDGKIGRAELEHNFEQLQNENNMTRLSWKRLRRNKKT
uniref:Uncharacterized protein n=1 Tax=Chenopodium quinoa TaxID=63459 RepID=A0A803MSK4_CHEQI